MATPPMHIYHSMLLHEALTAVHSSYGYTSLCICSWTAVDQETLKRQNIQSILMSLPTRQSEIS